MDEKFSEFNEQIRNCRTDRKQLRAKLAELKESKTNYRQAIETADEQLEVWETLKEDIESGKTVYDPSSGVKNDKKRKCRSSIKKRAKRPRQESNSDEESDSDFQDDELEAVVGDSEGYESTTENPARPLTTEEVNSKLNELRGSKKAARRQRVDLGRHIDTVESDLGEVELKMDAIQGQMNTLCITGRNEYSKRAIRQDFAAGIVSHLPDMHCVR